MSNEQESHTLGLRWRQKSQTQALAPVLGEPPEHCGRALSPFHPYTPPLSQQPGSPTQHPLAWPGEAKLHLRLCCANPEWKFLSLRSALWPQLPGDHRPQSAVS